MTIGGGEPQVSQSALGLAGDDLIDVAPALVRFTGPEGNCSLVNRRWVDLTGRPLPDHLGEGWAEALHPDDRSRCVAAWRDAVERRRPLHLEYRLLRGDGTYRWVVEHAVPFAAGGDAYTGHAAAALDITEHRGIDNEVHLALGASNTGTWSWDAATDRVTRDVSLCRIYGLGPEGREGNFDEWVALVHPDDRDRVAAEALRAAAEGGAYVVEHRIVRPDGTVRWVERRGEAFRDTEGKVAGTRGVVIDVTERKTAEIERDLLLDRVSRLQAVTAALSAAVTPEEVLDAVARVGLAACGAASAVVALPGAGGRLEIVRAGGARVPEAAVAALDEAMGGRRPVVAGPRDVALPLAGEGRVLGGLGLGFATREPFDQGQLAFLAAVAAQCADALERARLYRAEADARAEAESVSARLRFLLEASTELSASLAFDQRLERLARLAVEVLCDLCLVDIVEPDDSIRRVAAVHADPAFQPLADELRRFPPRPGTLNPSSRAAATGRPELCSEVTEETLARVTWEGRHLDVARALAPRSFVAMPLLARGRVLGVLTIIATARSERRYGPADLSLAEELARRVALGLDNTRLFEEVRRVAATLQASLLPPTLPAIPGLEVAARYAAAGEGAVVGGDFYDVFAAGDGAWAVLVGDVCGRGVEAATFTGLARHTLRSAVLADRRPSETLAHLNLALLQAPERTGPGQPDARFCTVCLVLLRPGPGSVEATIASGGHPAPFVLRAGGEVEVVPARGTLLGAFEEPDLADVNAYLGPGDALVLVTDGVLERHRDGAFFGEGTFFTGVLAGAAGQPAEEVARRVEAAARDFAPGDLCDDLAVVVVRVAP